MALLKAVLNIGLKAGRTAEDIPVDRALRELKKQGVEVEEYRILESDTEPTLVAQVDRPLTKSEGDQLSVALDQEAVAQKTADGGDLFGPKADEWGPFNEDYFLDIDSPGFFPEAKHSTLAPREQGVLERFQPPKGQPAAVAALDTPENIARIRGYVERGLEMGADRWYHTGGIKDKFIEHLGEELGPQAFDRFMDLKAATSPRSNVKKNLQRASVLHGRAMAGESVDVGSEAFPKGYGHFAHSTAHRPALSRYQETGAIGDPTLQPKMAGYGENLKGNYQPVTVDSHNWQIWSGKKGSPTDAQYPYIEALQQRLAAEMGLDPAEFQSALWAGAGDITKVKDVDNITPALNRRIANTARQLGVAEPEAARRFMSGKTQLYMPAAAATGLGVLAAPEEAEAGAFGRATQFVKKANNALGRVKRGGYTPDQGMKTALESIKSVNKLGGDLSPVERQAASDAIWETYRKLQGMGTREGVDVRGEAFMSPRGALETDPFRAERPFTPEEAAEVSEMMMVERVMSEGPPPTGDVTGQKFSDLTKTKPTPAYHPYSDPFERFSPESSEWVEVDIPGEKTSAPAVGAAGTAAMLEDDAPDAGVLADPTLEDDNGRIRKRGWSLAGDVPGMLVDAAQDLASKSVSGLSGLGTLLMGGSLEEAINNINSMRGMTYEEQDELTDLEVELAHLMIENPRTAAVMQSVLETVMESPAALGEVVYETTGSPGWAAAAQGLGGTALDIF